MHEDRLGRRQVLRRAGLITGGVAATSVGLASPALASGGQDDDRLEGSYMITRTDDGGPGATTSVFSLAGGGVLVNQDIDPPDTHSTGSWAAATGRGRFTSTHWTGFPADESTGTPALTARVRTRGRVQRGAISGTYDVSFFLVPTGEEVFVVTGTYAGPRIVA
jgi:hypothetical protein